MTRAQGIVLGGGVTGLAAGIASGLPVFEAAGAPGGICSSYYLGPGETERLPTAPEDCEAYRFEIGGGHWIFGADPLIAQFVCETAPVGEYARRSGVWFADDQLYVPYPLQDHLSCLSPSMARQALKEMYRTERGPVKTMEDWLLATFGRTLCDLFFVPFHRLYTAGLYESIAPQDGYKSPVNTTQVIDGAFGVASGAGYNRTYMYPNEGLDVLAQRMADRCDIRYGKRVVRIDLGGREIQFADGTAERYEKLLSTLALNRMVELAELSVVERPDPHTSVLVLNIGGVRGRNCPDDHWLYHPRTRAGFHRTGIYSNVDPAFLPKSARETCDRVSIYVERAFRGGVKPAREEIDAYSRAVVAELQEWGFIEDVEVLDPTWIDVAYTWRWPGSQWRESALRILQENNIYMIGRYGRWRFQGIADSIRDGFIAGASFRSL